MTDEIKNKVKDSHYYKFTGVAPEGFTLVPNDVLEKLKVFDTWKEWKNRPEMMHEMIKDYCVNNLF